MKKLLIATLLALLAPSFALAQTGAAERLSPTQSQLEAEVLKASEALDAAFMKQDPAALALLLADECVSINREGVHDKAQEVANLRVPNQKIESIQTDEKRLRLYGDTAVQTGRFTIKGSNRLGRPFTEIGRFTTIWVKRDGRWQIVADHVSPADE